MSYGKKVEKIENEGERREDALIRLHGAVSSYHKGKVSTLAAVLAGGRALSDLRPLASYGEWGGYLADEGLSRGRAWNWQRLAELGMSAQQVHDGGGMRATLSKNKVGKPPKHLECDHHSNLTVPKGGCSVCIQAALPIDEDVVVGEEECKSNSFCYRCLYDERELVVRTYECKGHLHMQWYRIFHGSSEAFTYECDNCDATATQSQMRSRRALLALPPTLIR